MSEKVRLDQYLVDQDHYSSRARARDAVLRGTVSVNGHPASKPGQTVTRDTVIAITDEAQAYVSRSALKLKHALAQFGLQVSGLNALDMGASTGGFTQVLLENGAASVHAIDVGHDQLAGQVAQDTRVVSIEGLNARDLRASDITGPIEFIACDVSFISLKLALPPALALAEPGASLVALIKPQFELGRGKLGKGGLVRADTDLQSLCGEIANWLENTPNWRVIGTTPSPIMGGDGNREFLIAACKP